MAPMEINPEDAKQLGNDYGATYAMAYPEPDIKRGQVFMMFGYPNGVQGDTVSEWTDRNIIPYYKGAWATSARSAKTKPTNGQPRSKVADIPESKSIGKAKSRLSISALG